MDCHYYFRMNCFGRKFHIIIIIKRYFKAKIFIQNARMKNEVNKNSPNKQIHLLYSQCNCIYESLATQNFEEE